MAAEKTKTVKQIKAGGIAGIVLTGLTLLQILLPVAGFTPATLLGFIMHSRAEASGKPLPEIGGASGLYLVLNLSVFCLVAALTVGVFEEQMVHCVAGGILHTGFPSIHSFKLIPVWIALCHTRGAAFLYHQWHDGHAGLSYAVS